MIKNLYILLLLMIMATTGLTAIACGCGCSDNNYRSNNQSLNQERVNGEKVQCPVMKNWILLSQAADSTEYNGKTYYFCCGGCKSRFLEDPEKYISELSNDS